MDTQIDGSELGPIIMNRFVTGFKKCHPNILYRALLTLSRLKYTSNQHFSAWLKIFDEMAVVKDPLADTEEKNMAQVVKILNVMFLLDGPEAIKSIPENLWKALCRYVKDNQVHEILFCNTCNLFGIFLEKKILLEQVLPITRQFVGLLVEIAKEKVGNWRKNAAILLGKCSFDQRCREELDRNHGMEVLKSIAPFILEKK